MVKDWTQNNWKSIQCWEKKNYKRKPDSFQPKSKEMTCGPRLLHVIVCCYCLFLELYTEMRLHSENLQCNVSFIMSAAWFKMTFNKNLQFHDDDASPLKKMIRLRDMNKFKSNNKSILRYRVVCLCYANVCNV